MQDPYAGAPKSRTTRASARREPLASTAIWQARLARYAAFAALRRYRDGATGAAGHARGGALGRCYLYVAFWLDEPRSKRN